MMAQVKALPGFFFLLLFFRIQQSVDFVLTQNFFRHGLVSSFLRFNMDCIFPLIRNMARV